MKNHHFMNNLMPNNSKIAMKSMGDIKLTKEIMIGITPVAKIRSKKITNKSVPIKEPIKRKGKKTIPNISCSANMNILMKIKAIKMAKTIDKNSINFSLTLHSDFTIIILICCILWRNVMKRMYLLFVFILFGQIFAAKWEKTLVTGLNINQVSFSNWKKGGEDAFSWTTRLDGNFVLKDSLYHWDSKIKVIFGQTKVDEKPFRKSIDELSLEMVYSRNLGIYVDPYISTKIETQIAPGYKYSETEGDKVVSKFFDPGYVTESLGLGINPLKPVKIRLGMALKQTITSKYASPYADNPHTTKIEKIKYEKGGQLSIDVDWKINKNVFFKSNTSVFSNMEWIRQVDVKIDNLLVSKISKIFNINFEYNILYDYDQSTQIQVRQAFALGINFNLL